MGMDDTEIPYEKQSGAQPNRMCGAACLSMAYRSFGKEVPQEAIWQNISKPNRFGTISSMTYLMAQDAANRGFSAVAVQARHPLQTLRICHKAGIRAIVNHRVRRDAPDGHYSLLVGMDNQYAFFHDPLLGPSRRLTHAELLELWMPNFATSEVPGHGLIALAPASHPMLGQCEICHKPIPPEATCPRCQKTVSLLPDAVLSCIDDRCIARMWERVCCPFCNHTWTFQPGQEKATANPVHEDSTAQMAQGININQLFTQIDKFCNHIRAVPAAAEHPDVSQQLSFIDASKERFRLAYAEELNRQSALRARYAAVMETAKTNQEAHQKAMQASQATPVDGDALARALLKNLGFTR